MPHNELLLNILFHQDFAYTRRISVLNMPQYSTESARWKKQASNNLKNKTLPILLFNTFIFTFQNLLKNKLKQIA